MKKMIFGAVAVVAMSGVATAQDSLAYWSQNNNSLPGGGFGFQPGDFPQAADFGVQAGSATLTFGGGQLDQTEVNGNGDLVYTWIQSFGGTSDNAQFGEGGGGSLSFQAGTDSFNNGMFFDLTFDASLYQDIDLSWAQRGTSSGFQSRVVSVSTDGVNFTEIYSNQGVLSSSWTVEMADAGSLLDGASTAIFRFTLDGATSGSGTGNNRFDNILIQGTLIPTPGAAGLLGLAGLVAVRRRR
jgi:hypothetical protein